MEHYTWKPFGLQMPGFISEVIFPNYSIRWDINQSITDGIYLQITFVFIPSDHSVHISDDRTRGELLDSFSPPCFAVVGMHYLKLFASTPCCGRQTVLVGSGLELD